LPAAQPTANKVVGRTSAPIGDREAVIFERSCGATTSFSTQISLVERGGLPSAKGDIFIADTDRGTAEAAEWGGPWAEVRWVSNTELLVRHDRAARLFRAVPSAQGVQIRFEPVSLLARTRTRARGDIPDPTR
jgi:hypothetical protein